MPEETVFERKLVFARINNQMSHDVFLSEKERLEQVKKGNREAYQWIVQKYMKTAYYIALGYVHNQQDALDISQEAFIKAFRKIKRFDSEKPFFPWFYKLMKNLCLDHLKKSSRTREIPIEEIHVVEVEKEDKDMKEVLWKGIRNLPFEQREVIILRYFRQLSYKEIAETVEKPIGTVMSSLYYAKKRLRDCISKYLGLG
jgi:RNA polymerase sigma-70 factor (ECF subfamily)